MITSDKIDLTALDVSKCMGLNGKQLKVMLVLCSEANYPSGIFHLSERKSKILMEMTQMKSAAQRNSMLYQLRSMGHIKNIAKGAFMIDPEFYFEGDMEEYELAKKQFREM